MIDDVVTPVHDDADQIDGATARSVVVRFSHIDAAGIIFYPRYFELLSQAYPESPFAVPPFAMKTEYRKPNRLGDKVRIAHDANGSAPGWSFSGQMDGREHFLVTGQQLQEEVPALDAHRPQEPAFQAAALNIAAWATDYTGCLQVSRFFELVNYAVEQWFEKMLGMPFYELHLIHGLGIPTVEMNTRCRALPHIGDLVTMWVRPTKIGSRSLVFTCWLVGDDGCLVENEQVIVFVKMTEGGFETITIPDDIRSRLETQLQTVK